MYVYVCICIHTHICRIKKLGSSFKKKEEEDEEEEKEEKEGEKEEKNLMCFSINNYNSLKIFLLNLTYFSCHDFQINERIANPTSTNVNFLMIYYNFLFFPLPGLVLHDF